MEEWRMPDQMKDKLSSDICLRAWFKALSTKWKSSHPKEGLKWQNSPLSVQFSNEHLGTDSATSSNLLFTQDGSAPCFEGCNPPPLPPRRMRRVANVGQGPTLNTSFSASTQPGTQTPNLSHADSLQKGFWSWPQFLVPSKRSNCYFQAFLLLF